MNFLKHLNSLYNITLGKANEVHRHTIQAIMLKLLDLEKDLDLMLMELCITTATGEWLDEWGSWFGVYRKLYEEDKIYSNRIISSIKAPKSTINAIKENAANFLNTTSGENKFTKEDIIVFEPYEYLAMYSHRGTLSGQHRFEDAEYWRRNVIDISLPADITQEFIDMLDTVRAAGVKVVYSVRPFKNTVISQYENSNIYSKNLIYHEFYVGPETQGNSLSLKNSYCFPLSGRRIIYGITVTIVQELINLTYPRIPSFTLPFNWHSPVIRLSSIFDYVDDTPLEELWKPTFTVPLQGNVMINTELV